MSAARGWAADECILGLEPVSVDTTAQGEMQLTLGAGLKDLQVRSAGVAELTLLQVLMSS